MTKARLDPTGFSLLLERLGDQDVRKSVDMHINFGLFASILSALASSVRRIPRDDIMGVLLAALTAMIMLPLLRLSSSGGVALAMCPALLHSGEWFAILVVVPFPLAAVIPCAVLSR